MFNDRLKDKKMFAIYLKDQNGNLLIFEDLLNKLKVDISNIKCDSIVNAKDGLLWFSKVLPSNVKATPSILPKTATSTWQSQLYENSY